MKDFCASFGFARRDNQPMVGRDMPELTPVEINASVTRSPDVTERKFPASGNCASGSVGIKHGR